MARPSACTGMNIGATRSSGSNGPSPCAATHGYAWALKGESDRCQALGDVLFDEFVDDGLQAAVHDIAEVEGFVDAVVDDDIFLPAVGADFFGAVA